MSEEDVPLYEEAPKVLSLMPIFGEPHSRTLMGVLDLPWPHIFVHGDPWICRVRSVLAQLFLETDAEWSFWVDQDVVFTREQAMWFVRKCIDANVDMACGMYPKKEFGGGFACGLAAQPGKTMLFGDPQSEMVPCNLLPMGFTVVHRRVFEGTPAEDFMTDHQKKAKGWFFHLVRGGVFRGEDQSFQYRAMDAGFTAWVDPGTLVNHVGTYTYTATDALGDKGQFRKAEESEIPKQES